MPIYALGDIAPEIHPDAFVHPEAVLIGHVTVGAEASIWPSAVLRGDEDPGIHIGDRSSVQDGAVLHVTEDLETRVGDNCVIGHIAHLEGCTIEDLALVGSGSVVLHAAVVRSGGVVGANAVVPNRMEVPGGMMALGIPAQLRPSTMSIDYIKNGSAEYVERCRRFRAELRRIS
jgi:carbonic anhydrase/acetyltransferase-like protein (isoleucine patch superfamily)